MTTTPLTYCGNVHPAENLDDWIEGVETWSVPVAAAQPERMGLGAWWNATVARQLAESEPARARVRELLDRHDLEIWTLNVFPFGNFHDERVKERVYNPSWDDRTRLRYTLDAARAVASLVKPGVTVPLSTLPLGFEVGFDAERREAAAGLIAECAEALAELGKETGVHCVLALEPEPFCAVETAAGVADFLEQRVFARQGSTGEDRLRRHVGVCLDLCHLAVVGEDPVGAWRDLSARGVAVPKVQISSCLELRDPAQALDQLLAFDEPRYLHQTVSDSGLRALDLAEVRARAEEFARARRIRTHFHMPVFWDGEMLGSTRSEVEQFLGVLPAPFPVLEVETYTWSVLDSAAVGAGDLVQGLCDELAFARSLLRL